MPSAVSPSLALGARVVLAGALAVSGTAKLRSRDEVRAQMRSLAGERVAPVVAVALPIVELIVAVALLAWWNAFPAAGALVLLAGFTVVLVRAQARRLPCPCFGAARPESPVGPWSVLRNGVLAALAVFALASPSGASAAPTVLALSAMGGAAALAVRLAR